MKDKVGLFKKQGPLQVSRKKLITLKDWTIKWQMKFYVNKCKIIHLGWKASCDCMLCSARLHVSCCCSGKSPWNSCRQVYANLSSQLVKKLSKYLELIERGQTTEQKTALTLLKYRVDFLFFVTRQVNRCVLSVTIQLSINWFHRKPIQFKNSRPKEWQKCQSV